MLNDLNILLIDDDVNDRELVTALIEKYPCNHTVYCARDADEAKKIIKDTSIDCAIIDYHLPTMNGLEVIDKLNNNVQDMIATIVLTGDPNQSIQAEAARKGAMDFIVKETSDIQERIYNVLEKCPL